MLKRTAIVFYGICLFLIIIIVRLLTICMDENIKNVAQKQGSYTLTLGKSYGNIYDCNFKPLTNTESKIIAAVYPNSNDVQAILPYVIDKDEFYKKLQSNLPFSTEVVTNSIPNSNAFCFDIYQRYSSNQLAPHIVGYTIDNKGVTGLERSYDNFLRGISTTASIRYNITGIGNVLEGLGSEVTLEKNNIGGVVTTLDSDIQAICQEAAKKMKKGAVIVMDPYTGEMKAVVSMPNFSPLDVKSAVDDSNSPLFNRAFSAYNVGSIFKLVVASVALEEGISPDNNYTCTGEIFVKDQKFKCHDLDGHGELDMKEAIKESCNTYFIDLSTKISSEDFLEKATDLGFGKSTILAINMITARGNLQTLADLYNPAEKANLSFGQGMLTATPVQIACMTSAIANDGMCPQARLIKGLSSDGINIDSDQTEAVLTKAMKQETAETLRSFMDYAINESDTSYAKPSNVKVAAKTSTAQTGQYNDDGTEIVQAWITGYFPTEKPKYVITVLVEDGSSGNASAGPIFKEIAEKITELDTKAIDNP